MRMKKKGLNVVLALGIAFTQTLAQATPSKGGSEVTTPDDRSANS